MDENLLAGVNYMRLYKYIKEEYLTRVKSSIAGSAEVFVNPSKKELREIGEVVRFIADNNTKKIYTWNAVKAFHKQTWRQIKEKSDSRLEIDPTLLSGTATRSGVIYRAYPEYRDYQDPKKFKWVRKYSFVLEEE